jgi:sugar lactone lactonase YvrE
MPSKPSPAPEVQTLLTGLAFGESPRWHTDRLWFADWGKQQYIRNAPLVDGTSTSLRKAAVFHTHAAFVQTPIGAKRETFAGAIQLPLTLHSPTRFPRCAALLDCLTYP